MQERGQNGPVVVPYYKYSEEIVSQAVKNVQSLDLGNWKSIRPAIVTRLEDIYAKGVISDARVKLERSSAKVSDNLIYVQKNKRATQTARSEVYTVSEAKDVR